MSFIVSLNLSSSVLSSSIQTHGPRSRINERLPRGVSGGGVALKLHSVSGSADSSGSTGAQLPGSSSSHMCERDGRARVPPCAQSEVRA